jgi:hypothetical protein
LESCPMPQDNWWFKIAYQDGQPPHSMKNFHKDTLAVAMISKLDRETVKILRKNHRNNWGERVKRIKQDSLGWRQQS